MRGRSSMLCRAAFAVAALGFSLGTVTCGGSGTGGPGDPNDPNDPNNPNHPANQDLIEHLYAKTTTEIKLEIDYQTGAEPYVRPTLGMDPWDLFKANAGALFDGHKSVAVPTTLAQMEALSDISGANFTVQQMLDIAKNHRGTLSTTTSASFYVLFLNGYYHDGTMERRDVLGVSIGRTGVIAMFKPVIAGTGTLNKFVEQSTLVHEFGHAVGLVNNGVAMVTAHQDTQHGAHDMNSRCIMYYANEGAADAVQFVQRSIITGNEVLFDDKCIADVAARLR